MSQHGRQRQQAHGNNGGANDAGAGGEQHAYQHYRDTQSATYTSEQCGHGFEQVLCDS